jgi:hypothetical protein
MKLNIRIREISFGLVAPTLEVINNKFMVALGGYDKIKQ